MESSERELSAAAWHPGIRRRSDKVRGERWEAVAAGGKGRQAGFSLLEFLVALGLSVVLGAALLLLTTRFVLFERVFASRVRIGESLEAFPGLLNRYAAGAGNRQPAETGMEVQLQGFSVRSDQDGPEGFPDGDLDDSFESLSLRVDGGQLQLRIGSGGFQTILEGLESLGVTRPEPRSLHASVSAITDLESSLVHSVSGSELELDVFLWNYRPLLFPRSIRGGGSE